MSLTPKTFDKYIGIEIECVSEKTEQRIRTLITKYKLKNYIVLSRDSSIKPRGLFSDRECNICNGLGRNYNSIYNRHFTCGNCGGHGTVTEARGYELQLLVKQKELRLVLNKISLLLKDIDAKVNDSCGLHVHLDMRNRKFTDAVQRLLNVQGIMLKSVPKSRRNNQYCKPVKLGKNTDLRYISKYHTIHTEDCMNDYSTVEVRVHEGTVDTDAIYKWVKFLTATIDGSFAVKPIRTVRLLPLRVQKYIKERMAAYG
jgi:hypothetical protein